MSSKVSSPISNYCFVGSPFVCDKSPVRGRISIPAIWALHARWQIKATVKYICRGRWFRSCPYLQGRRWENRLFALPARAGLCFRSSLDGIFTFASITSSKAVSIRAIIGV